MDRRTQRNLGLAAAVVLSVAFVGCLTVHLDEWFQDTVDASQGIDESLLHFEIAAASGQVIRSPDASTIDQRRLVVELEPQGGQAPPHVAHLARSGSVTIDLRPSRQGMPLSELHWIGSTARPRWSLDLFEQDYSVLPVVRARMIAEGTVSQTELGTVLDPTSGSAQSFAGVVPGGLAARCLRGLRSQPWHDLITGEHHVGVARPTPIRWVGPQGETLSHQTVSKSLAAAIAGYPAEHSGTLRASDCSLVGRFEFPDGTDRQLAISLPTLFAATELSFEPLEGTDELYYEATERWRGRWLRQGFKRSDLPPVGLAKFDRRVDYYWTFARNESIWAAKATHSILRPIAIIVDFILLYGPFALLDAWADSDRDGFRRRRNR